MLRDRNRTRGGSGLPAPTTFDLTSAIPTGFTYTRNDTVATYRDNTGQMQRATANTPRFDHTIAGVPRGYLAEGAIVNKLTDRNANPTNTTGWTVGGDVAATLAAVTDPSSYLSGAKLTNVCTAGNVYKLDNTLGITDAYAQSVATFAAVTVHTISAWVVSTGANCQLSRSGAGTVPTLDITAGTFARYQLPLTPNATTDQMRIVAKPGAIVYFILGQIEALDFATTEIITNAGTGSRALDVLVCSTLASQSWFNESTGAIFVKAAYEGIRASGSQYLFAASNNGTTNIYGLRIQTGTFRPNVVGGGVTKLTSSNSDKPTLDKAYPAGLSWRVGEAFGSSGPGQYITATYTGDPTGLTHLNIGGRAAGADSAYARISEITIYKYYQKYNTLIDTADKIIVGGGQSNMVNYFVGVETTGGLGEIEFVRNLDLIWTSTLNLYGNGATNASYLCQRGTGTDVWWYDDRTNTFGDCYDLWEQVALGCNGRIQALHWDQGEADASPIYQGTNGMTIAIYKASLLAVFNKMRSVVGELPVFITPLGSHDTLTGETYQDIRQAQYELAAEYDWIYTTPEKFDLARIDDVHLTDASYVTQAERNARKILKDLGETIVGGVNGPRVTGAVRSGTTVTATLVYNSATDMTPATLMQGFRYFDNSLAEVALSSVSRASATTITMTLASGVAGTLYYGYAELDEITDLTKMVRDNNTIPLPLQTAVAVVA